MTGGDMVQPMASAAIDGLLTGNLVALFLMPCLYFLFTEKKETIWKVIHRNDRPAFRDPIVRDRWETLLRQETAVGHVNFVSEKRDRPTVYTGPPRNGRRMK